MTRRLDVVHATPQPRYVVWELTLRCDHACHHCGSRAGKARSVELTTTEAVSLVRQLADMGTNEVVLIGGEAYLHDGFLQVVRALRAAGVRVQVTTGGRGVTIELARAMADAGVQGASVSIDGLEETHDRMRNARGSFRAGLAALRRLRDAGVPISANTNVNRLNRHDLDALYGRLLAVGVSAWQIQITAPLGRAADRPDMLLQPWHLLDLLPRIAELKRRAHTDGVRIMAGNNLGYFGPEEADLRSIDPGGSDHFQGCQAGRHIMGIESDGAIKGCPSLQSRHYVGGNVRSRDLQSIWNDAPELAFNRKPAVDALWGFCKSCPFAATCQAGCTFTAHALLGRRGNNPYCHYRARDFAQRGMRERLTLVEGAKGAPFDNGRFTIMIEPLDADEPGLREPDELVQIRRPHGLV